MEVQFPTKTLNYLHLVKRDIQTQEQTQELRMPEDKPDIGKILGTWGQVLLRGKEWRDGEVVVTGGVMTWILYQADGEEVPLQTVEAWIPFQMKYEIPSTQHDGTICVCPLLHGVDARTTSARKMVARVTVSALMEAYTQEDIEVSQPPDVPTDINLLVHAYPVVLPRECGEKTFEMEEELTLPGSSERLQQIVRFSFQPEILDQKVLSGKVVFRGVGNVHLLYKSENGNFCTWDFEVPFSRYAELENVYEQEAQSVVNPVLTGLELELDDEGKLLLKAALTGQYIIFDRSEIEIVQDAYSNLRKVEMTANMLELPVVLDRKITTIPAEVSLEQDELRVVDVAFYPNQPRVQRNGEIVRYALSGQFHMLLCDESKQMHGSVRRWNGDWEFQAATKVIPYSMVLPASTLHQSTTSNGVSISGNILLDTTSIAQDELLMLSSVEFGSEVPPNGDRPSLILRRVRDNTLWDIAKTCGSTVESIRIANHLDGEPDPERMLLIPVQ